MHNNLFPPTSSPKFTRRRRNEHEKPVSEKVSIAIIENVSHVLRTPLNVMLGYASLLHEGALGTLTLEQQRAMSAIVKRTDEMSVLVARLNILMEAEAGLGHIEEVSLDEILRNAIAEKKDAVERAGIALNTEIEVGIPPLMANIPQLREAVGSLIDNAIEFTPRGGSVTVKIYADAAWVCLEVADEGIGISEDAQRYMFKPFGKAYFLPQQYGGGIGLGLSIVRSVVERHGGHISVVSRPGEGSRFTLQFPLVPSAQQVVLKEAPQVQRILVVDDDPDVSFTIHNILQKLPNCEIVVATSGEQALQHVAQQPFDLVLTDYKMPKMNGIELTKAIRALSPTTLVMWVTAHCRQELQAEAQQLNVHRCLTKPLDIAGIRQTAQEALKSQR